MTDLVWTMMKVWWLAKTSPPLLFSVGLFLVVLLCFTLRLCFFSLCSSISRLGFDDWIWDDVMGGHVEGGGDEIQEDNMLSWLWESDQVDWGGRGTGL